MGLETERDILELADGLTRSADAIHVRLRKATKARQVDQVTAQSLFQNEVLLRQRANALYTGAALCVVQGLTQSQTELMGVVKTASDRIRDIKALGHFLDLVADLLVLATAACAAKPGPILAALKEVQRDVEDLGEG